MGTSVYFNNFSATRTNEQRLFEDLLSESIRIHGHDIYYMPREDWNDTDNIYGENIHSKFERAYQMEMYIANVEGFEGDSEFFSKFGLEIRDSSNFVVTKRTFDKYVPTTITDRPREGDLIFVPTFNKIFEIKFIEEQLLFFARRGRRVPYMYELRAEAFRYANEPINTGVDAIDQMQKYTYNIKYTASGLNNFIIGETVYQGSNLNYATATATVADWNPANNIVYLTTIKGDFKALVSDPANSTIKGVQSGTSRNLSTTDTYATLADNTYYDLYNNKDIQVEANNFVDMSEINPFGMP